MKKDSLKVGEEVVIEQQGLQQLLDTSLTANMQIEAGLEPMCLNPFKSIIARSVESLYACDEALRIIEKHEMPVENE